MTKASRVPVIGILLTGVICPSARVSAQQRPAIADQIAKTYGLDSCDHALQLRADLVCRLLLEKKKNMLVVSGSKLNPQTIHQITRNRSTRNYCSFSCS